MITGLANLGASLRGSSGLGENLKSKNDVKTPGLSKNQASEFDQILSQESDKEARTNYASKDPVPVEKGLQRLKPEKVDKQIASSSANEPRMAQKEETGREESGSVKAKKVGEKVGKKSEDSSQTREQVMLQFMDSMESEFNIPPARIAEAMTNLSDGEMEASPEASASQVITQLNLPTDQEQKAYALYMGMLAQLKQVEQPSLKTSEVMAQAGMTGSGLAAVLSQKEKKDQLNNSLDQLSQKFFMKNQAPAQNAMAPAQVETASMENSLPELSPRTLDVQAYNAKDLNIANMKMPKNEMAMPDKSYQELSSEASELKRDILAEMQKVDPQSDEGQKLAKALATLGAATSALDQAAQGGDNNSMPQAAPAGFAAALKKEDSTDFGNSSDKGGQSTGEGNSFFSHHVASSTPHSAKAEASSTLAAPTFAGAMGRMEAGAQDNQANIQQIMKQAQYMIKKGGGESKVQLNPEGLGEIHMKVLVNDGKVNLEMTTESKETKKLLESSINDLKSNLSQHKLSVDHVRVDVGTQSTNDQRQDSQNLQKQMDMRQEQSQNQQRDQARDFWSQFQDGGFERRASFFESPGIRAYGGSRRTEPLAPGSSSGVSEKRYSGSGKGRGIDLVA